MRGMLFYCMERVQTIEGDYPVLLVAPHGADDANTDIIAEEVADKFGAYAVINKGWKKSSSVDCWRDLANCDDVKHLHSEVVKEEFLDPILRYVASIKRKHDEKVLVLVLHGCDNKVKEESDDQFLDIILGFGAGIPASYTCSRRLRKAFAHYLQRENFVVYEGGSWGKYSGRSKNNLNQLFRFWYPDPDVKSLQLEMVSDLRLKEISTTVDGLVGAIDSLMVFDDTVKVPKRTAKRI